MRTSDRFDTWATRALGFRGNLCSFNVRWPGSCSQAGGVLGVPPPQGRVVETQKPPEGAELGGQAQRFERFFSWKASATKECKSDQHLLKHPPSFQRAAASGGHSSTPCLCLSPVFIHSFLHSFTHSHSVAAAAVLGRQWASLPVGKDAALGPQVLAQPLRLGSNGRVQPPPMGSSAARFSYPLSQEKPDPWDKA